MPRGEMFTGSNAPEWQGEVFVWLAGKCAHFKLTWREAGCLNCYVRGQSLRQTAQIMGISSRSQVRDHIRGACEKLGVMSKRRGTARRWMSSGSVKTTLDLMRTVDCNPRPLTYDQLGRPVTLRSKIIAPSDFGEWESDWMDDLDFSMVRELEEMRAEEAASR